jgi:hypothetical protein
LSKQVNHACPQCYIFKHVPYQRLFCDWNIIMFKIGNYGQLRCWHCHHFSWNIVSMKNDFAEMYPTNVTKLD